VDKKKFIHLLGRKTKTAYQHWLLSGTSSSFCSSTAIEVGSVEIVEEEELIELVELLLNSTLSAVIP
jgi:hypothetical protein